MRLTEQQFNGLKIGDKVLLKSRKGDYRSEAEVTVADNPEFSVWVIVDKVTHKGNQSDIAEGKKRIAGRDELYLAITERLT